MDTYAKNVIVLYTDTDSLILEIFNGNPNEDKTNIEDFVHQIFLGSMKDEFAGKLIDSMAPEPRHTLLKLVILW